MKYTFLLSILSLICLSGTGCSDDTYRTSTDFENFISNSADEISEQISSDASDATSDVQYNGSEEFELSSITYGDQRCIEIENMLTNYIAGGQLDTAMLSQITGLRIYGTERVSVICGSVGGTNSDHWFNAVHDYDFFGYDQDPDFDEFYYDLNYGNSIGYYYYNISTAPIFNDYCISNIDFVKYMPNLEILEAPCNHISDISPLKSCTHLKHLNLCTSIYLEDITPVQYCRELQVLRLADSAIKNVSPISSLPALRKLDISKTEIQDLSPLQSVRSLEVLELDNTTINDFQQIVGIPSLKALKINKTNFDDLSKLNGMTSLENLCADDNPITNLSSGPIDLPNLVKLKIISHYYCGQLKDIDSISRLTSLKELHLNDNIISDISELSSLYNLEVLHLDGNNIKDLSTLDSLDKLETLTYKRTPLTNGE